MWNIVRYYIAISLFSIILIATLSEVFTGRGESVDFGTFLEEASPNFFCSLGIFSCVSFSILGAAIGIYTVGSSMMGIGIKKPHVKTKNIVSIIFCEATAIYGLIMAIVMCGYMEQDEDPLESESRISKSFTGYLMFGAGISVGFVNLVSGISIGIIGSATVLADGGRPETFVKNLIIEIFAGAISLFGLIVGVYMCSKGSTD